MKKFWIVILIMILGVIGFIAYYNRGFNFYFQNKIIRNNISIINANSDPEELRMIGSIDSKIFSGIVKQYDTLLLLDKIHLDDSMLGYRLIFSYGDGINIYIRTHGKQVWYLSDIENCTGYCVNTLSNRLTFDMVPTKVIDIVIKTADHETLVLQGSTGDWIDMVERGP